MKKVIEAVVGSTAYGLETESSDVDILGVYVAPTVDVLGLTPVSETIVTKEPDTTFHEVGKFMHLCTKCNPTVLELLFLNDYTVLTEEGKLLRDNRKYFLSKVVKNSYGGYALSQAKKLNVRAYRTDELDSKLKDCKVGFEGSTKNRTFKHARHCFRLLDQGQQLLELGEMDVKVKNRDELMSLGELTVDEVVRKFEARFKEFNESVCILPDTPNMEMLNEVILKIRSMNYDRI